MCYAKQIANRLLLLCCCNRLGVLVSVTQTQAQQKPILFMLRCVSWGREWDSDVWILCGYGRQHERDHQCVCVCLCVWVWMWHVTQWLDRDGNSCSLQIQAHAQNRCLLCLPNLMVAILATVWCAERRVHKLMMQFLRRCSWPRRRTHMLWLSCVLWRAFCLVCFTENVSF